jgi:hypothetical protein
MHIQYIYSSPHNSFRPSFIVLHLTPATPFFSLLFMRFLYTGSKCLQLQIDYMAVEPQYLTPLIIYLAIVYVPDRVPFLFHPHNRFP